VRHGYPSHVPPGQSTLGFFPLYPLVIVAVSWLLHLPALVAALLISSASGLVGLLLAERLVEEWWGYVAGKKAFLSRHGSTVSFLAAGTGISLEGYTWVLGIGFMTLWSIRTPPNPRMLMLAFPSIAIWAEHLKTKGLIAFVTVETVAFLVMSAMTLHGRLLTP